LASNQLTIAATAAMPAFGLLGVALWYLRSAFRPKKSSDGNSTLHFRLIMSDVERSLQELEDLSSATVPFQMLNSPSFKRVKRHDDAERLSFLMHSEREAATIVQPTKDTKRVDVGLDVDHNSQMDESEPTKVIVAVETVNFSNYDINEPPSTPNTKHDPLSAPPSTNSLSTTIVRSFIFDPLGTNNALRNTSTVPMFRRTMSFKGTDELSTKTLLNDAIKGRAQVDTSLPLEERVYKVTKGKYYFNLFRLRQEFGELFEWNSSSISSLKPVSNATKRFEQTQEADERNIILPQDSTISNPNSFIGKISELILSTGNLFKAIFSALFASNDLLHSTTQYGSINQDIQLLEAPDFEVSIRRKLATIQRMRVSYKCLAPVS